jgi:hypothetical protein
MLHKKLALPLIISSALIIAGCLANPGNQNTVNTAPQPNYPQQNTGPVNVSDLYNTNAGYAKQQLQMRGFNQISATPPSSAGFSNSQWSNAATGQCFNLEEANNNVMTLNPCQAAVTQLPANSGYNSAPVSAQPIIGQTPPALANTVGAKGGQAEDYLMNNGYVNRKTHGLTAFWSEQATGGCVAIRTADGRYQSITYVDPSNCR